MKKEILEMRSTNGRWGVSIVSSRPAPAAWPAEGLLQALGRADGREVYEFTPAPGAGVWVLPGGDIEPLAGAEVVVRESLQSSAWGTVLVLGPVAIVRHWGYKRRSSYVWLYQQGERLDVPPSVLLAMGLIKPEAPPVEVPAPPPLAGALAEALRRAGVA